MKVRILYNINVITGKKDGTVSVTYPAPKSRRKDEAESEWLKRVFDKATPEGVEYEDIEKSELPQSREFRNAWTGQKGEGVGIDEVKKQAIINATKNKIH